MEAIESLPWLNCTKDEFYLNRQRSITEEYYNFQNILQRKFHQSYDVSIEVIFQVYIGIQTFSNVNAMLLCEVKVTMFYILHILHTRAMGCSTSIWVWIYVCLGVWRDLHDDVIKWKHFPRYWSFVRNSPVIGEFPTQLKASDAELWCLLWSAPE